MFRSPQGPTAAPAPADKTSPSDSTNQEPPPTPAACYIVRQQIEPPKFDGDDDADAERWLSEFERTAALNEWDPAARLRRAALYLRGRARRWAEIEEDRLDTWSRWTAAFKRRFDSGRAERARSRLQRLTHPEGEPLLDHLEEVIWLCRQVDVNMDERQVLDHFAATIGELDFACIGAARGLSSLEDLRTHLGTRARHAARRNRTGPGLLPPNVRAFAARAYSDLDPPPDRSPREQYAAPGRHRASPPPPGPPTTRRRDPPSTPPTPPRPRPRSPSAGRQAMTDAQYAPAYTGDRRATSGSPLCNYCNHVGHVMKYCRNRKAGRAPASRPRSEGRRDPPRSPSPRRTGRSPSPRRSGNY